MRWGVMVGALFGLVFATVFFWPSGAPSGVGAAALVASSSNASGPEGLQSFICTVTKVHDGDGPIWCAEGPKVRLTAIAARELDESCSPGHPCPAASGGDAQKELEGLALNQVLRCEQTGTSYNRITAWCWREDGVELNCAMVRSGKALRWERYDPKGRLCTE
jgi:endonuclease YncB( thermonuclease family)